MSFDGLNSDCMDFLSCEVFESGVCVAVASHFSFLQVAVGVKM